MNISAWIGTPRKRDRRACCPTSPTQLFATLLLWLCVSAPALAQLTFGPVVTASPTTATVGGTVTINASRLTGSHTYSARLVPTTGSPTTLFTQTSNADSLQKFVVIPSVAVGKYTLELRADNVLLDTASFGVVTPMAVTYTPTTAAPGASVAFTITGLTAGSLVLDYDGAPAFGPVTITGSSYSGKFRIPTDRPANLPATVATQARNLVGKVAPRIGNANFATKAANTSPFAKIVSATPSTGTVKNANTFNVTGKLAFNESSASDVTVSQFWQAADGSVVPFGASTFSVQPNGDFTSTQRAPQWGTMSAMQAVGAGQLMTVTQFRDGNDVPQFQSGSPVGIVSQFDTDSNVDVTLLIRDSNSAPLQHARIDLSTEQADDLFEDPNNAPVNIDGSTFAGHATQYNPNPQQSEGCPAGLQRQYTDAQGRAEFQFGVDPAGGGYLIDGSHLHQLTIAPSQECVRLPDGKGGYIERCTTVDPAGLAFTLEIRTAHLGYGYRDSQGAELPVTVNARVDRYTGQITTTTCKPPNNTCTQQSFNRSANLVISQPAVGSSLEVGDPYFQSDADSVAINPRPGQAAGGEPYRFDYVADLTQFVGAADFYPLRPPTLRFAYHRGAGRALREAHLLLENSQGGYDQVGDFTLDTNSTSCDSADGVEVWKYHFGGQLSSMLRFPRLRWPNKQGDFHACGYIYGSNSDGSFNRKFCLYWKAVSPDLLNLTDIVINDGLNPSQVSIMGTRTLQGGATHSGAAPSEYHVGAKDNTADSAAVFNYCVPSSGGSCNPYSEFSRQHQQFSHVVPPDYPDTLGGDSVQSAGSGQWEDLFNVTIPLFRWIWGVPELLSAEVFADLGIRAQQLFSLTFNPATADVRQTIGGAMGVTLWIGVDIDVLFGILVDAGAMISGAAISSIVATTGGDNAGVNECFQFRMDFTGWLEIGCPIPNPLDPTCYIPDINESFNILDERNPSGCAAPPQNPTLAAGLKSATNADGVRPPPVDPITPEERRALYRHPAIAFDTDGNGLALWLDDQGRLVSGPVLGRGVGSTHPVVSSGWGIRDVAVAFIGPGRAVAVWAENALSDDPFRKANLATRALNQHLRYATWDGKVWSAVADLTAPGKGEGQIRLARCSGSVVNCPRNGRVTAVWQRNTGQGIYAASMHVFTSNFDGTGWTTPVQVDQTGTLNITPTLTYQAGNPVVGWVRHDPAATLSDTTLRRFAYRQMDGHSIEHIDATIPAGIASPSLAAIDNNKLAVAFTVVDKGFGFIGTRQALFLGGADCSAGLCSFTSWKMHDTHGRSIYGERPQLLIDEDGQAVVTMRGLSFGVVAGNANNLFDDDPPGMRSTTGDLIQMRSPLADQAIPVIALSRDAATHFQPAAAYNPVTGEVSALSVNLASPTTLALQMQPTTMQSRLPAAASVSTVDAGVELAATALAPDLTIESVIVASGPLVPGGNLAVKVSVLNQGSAWIPDADRNAHVTLWWDNPQTRSAQTSSAGIPALDPGGRQTLQFSLPVPAVFHNDEVQTLRASIVTSAAVVELDGTNNEASRNLGGMPLPSNAIVVLAPGTRFTNLAWDLSSDARVKGYRVYVEDVPGEIRPLGSSFNAGFVDLAAQYGPARRYYVTTYSARGVESEKVGPLIAAPLAGDPTPDDALFKNGFEAPAP